MLLVTVVGLLLAAGIGVAAVALTDGSPVEAVVAPQSSVALIDPTENRLAAAIHVGDRPTRIAVHEDAISGHPSRHPNALAFRTAPSGRSCGRSVWEEHRVRWRWISTASGSPMLEQHH